MPKSIILEATKKDGIERYRRAHRYDKRIQKDFKQMQECLGCAQGSLDSARKAITSGKDDKADEWITSALGWLDDLANFTKLIGVDGMNDNLSLFVTEGQLLELLEELRKVTAVIDKHKIAYKGQGHTKKILDTMSGFCAARLKRQRAFFAKHRYDNWTNYDKKKK